MGLFARANIDRKVWTPPVEAVDPWFSLNIVGEGHANPDGSSREREIARCRSGEVVHLVREPKNKHDPKAVVVLSARQVQIGYLSRDRARWIGGHIDSGYRIEARVERIVGGTADKPSLGIVLAVRVSG